MHTQIVEIQPRELKFLFEVKKQSSCAVHLANVTDQYVAFKVKTTSPKKYCVRPNPVKDLDETNLKLMKDIEELKSKISTMDSELVKAKYMIEKLKEEKSNTIREKELLKQELATSRTGTVVRKVRAGFPPLFVCMVALISLVIGLLLRA
ncbi:Vesicle-associated protein 2-1 [Striga hermonthica]|uniref:Vesicle-associated protein 2-1 n=1 Tax=Striga hermonthica TaxID=68872 RepID=A0A9N7NWQ9_STRHE|nr:Vesicle-associated protein 2-1 [Striga hermonthica]